MISSNSQPLGGGDPLFVGRHSTMTRPNMMGAVPLYKDQYSSATANSFPLSGGVSAFPTTDATKTAYGRRDAPPVPNTWKQHPGAVPRSYYPQRQSQVNFLPARFDFNHAAADEPAATNTFAEWHTTARQVPLKENTLRQPPRSYRYGPPVPVSDRGYGAYTQPIPAPRIEQFAPAEPAAAIPGSIPAVTETETENVQSVWSMNAEQLASRQPQKQPGMTHTEFPTPGEIQQALSVAGEFAYHYFHLMQTEPNKLHCFYSTDSQLAHGSSVWEHTKWHRAIGESDIERLFDSVLASKMEGGNSLIVRSNVKTIEAQPTRDGGIVMQATGIIETRDLGSRPFAHTIVMNKAHNEGSYVVLHDIFVFLDDVLQIPPTVAQTAFIPSMTRPVATTTPAATTSTMHQPQPTPPLQLATAHAAAAVMPQSTHDTQMIPPVEPPRINERAAPVQPRAMAAAAPEPQVIHQHQEDVEVEAPETQEVEEELEAEEVEEEEEIVEEEVEPLEEEEESASAFPTADTQDETQQHASVAADSVSGAAEEETSYQREEQDDADVVAGGEESQSSNAEGMSEANVTEQQEATVAAVIEQGTEEEEVEEEPHQRPSSKFAIEEPRIENEEPHVEEHAAVVESPLTYDEPRRKVSHSMEAQPADVATKASIEEPPLAAPVNPWRREEVEDEALSLQGEEEVQEEAPAAVSAAPPQAEEKAPAQTTTAVAEEEPAPRQSAWKTIHRQPPAAPPIPVTQPEPVPKTVAPVVQRQVAPERTQHELPISLSNHEPNSYVAKLLTGLNAPPPVRGHVLKRSDESASTSPSTRELGTQEDITGYPCKAVWISQLETFTDAQIEYAVAERLKGCPTEGRVIRIERMRNGPAGMIELDSEDCVPLLLERGLCINGIEVRIDLYKQTPSQIVREPSGAKIHQQNAIRRGGGGRGRGQGVNREGSGEEEFSNQPGSTSNYRGRGWQGSANRPYRGARGGPRTGGGINRSEKLPTSTHMSSNEEVGGGDWEVVGRPSRRTKSGVHQ